MSMAALRWARGVRSITSTQKLVLWALADMANDYGEAWPSATGLAADCCLTDRAVRDAFDALEERGLIVGDRAHGRSTRWTIQIGAEPAPRSETPERGSDPADRGSETPECNGSVAHPGTTFRTTPEYGSGPPRNVVPVTPERGSYRTLKNPHLTPIKPPQRAKARTMTAALKASFDEFWRYYPRKRAKGDAEKAWPKAVAAAGGDPEPIIAGLKVAVSLDRFDMREGGKFCPYPATWLTGQRWLDEIEPEPDEQPSLPMH